MGAQQSIELFEDGELERDFEKAGGVGDISLWKLFKAGYRDIINSIVRPPRKRYNVEELGPVQFELEVDDIIKRRVLRKDLQIENFKGLKLECSHWQLVNEENEPQQAPCIVYLHSNIGSRLDALPILHKSLKAGFSVFAFDFCGCGRSEGLYITLGLNESRDVDTVMQYLTNETQATVSSVSLWGHSMGAVAAIVYSNRLNLAPGGEKKKLFRKLSRKFSSSNSEKKVTSPQKIDTSSSQPVVPITGLILDGAFTTLKKLSEDLMLTVRTEGLQAPMVVLQAGSKMIQASVEKRADFEMNSVRPIDYVPDMFTPALFFRGKDDKYVSKEHGVELEKNYGGFSKLVQFNGNHYDTRPDNLICMGVAFLSKAASDIDGQSLECNHLIQTMSEDAAAKLDSILTSMEACSLQD